LQVYLEDKIDEHSPPAGSEGASSTRLGFACLGRSPTGCNGSLVPQSTFMDYMEAAVGDYSDTIKQLSDVGDEAPLSSRCDIHGSHSAKIPMATGLTLRSDPHGLCSHSAQSPWPLLTLRSDPHGHASHSVHHRTLFPLWRVPCLRCRCGWLGNANGVAQREAFVSLLRGGKHAAYLEGGTRETLGGTGASLPLIDQVRRWSCLLDLRGIGFSARLPLLLHSGRTVMRTPASESGVWSFVDDAEHFPPSRNASGTGTATRSTDPLLPWVHYVPLQADLADLPAQARWMLYHPSEAADIGAAGREWARRHLTRDNVEDYLVERLFEAARKDQ
jgi:hypothetical protein